MLTSVAFLSLWKAIRRFAVTQVEVESMIRLNHNAFCQGVGSPGTSAKLYHGAGMSIERAEQLKRELTDKWVVVADQVPELRRFSSLTGKVRTVNMNCRALVEFDGPEDISWYDIDPQFLTVVDAPQPKKAAEEKSKPSAEKKAASPAKASSTSGGSPLDKIRAGAGGSKPAAPSGGSPLDKIRAGGAAKPSAPSGGSPLDQIRASSGGAAPAKAPEPAAAVKDEAEAAAQEPETEEVTPKPKADIPPGASPLDVIRAQGGFKG